MPLSKVRSSYTKSKLKQKKVLDLLVASDFKMSKREAMIKAGYSPSHAHNSGQLTKTKVWNELLDEYFPEDVALKVHKEMIQQKDENGKYDQVALQALILFYKIRGRLTPASTNVTVNNVIPLLGGDSKKNVYQNDSDRENSETDQEN